MRLRCGHPVTCSHACRASQRRQSQASVMARLTCMSLTTGDLEAVVALFNAA